VSDTDLDIIEAIRKGNSRRFGLLVDRHKDRAMTLALRLVGDRGEAEELVQDAFLRAFRNLSQFRGDAKFTTWFYRILYNVCMTHLLRRPKESPTFERGERESLEAHLVEADDISTLERLENEETQLILQEEMDRLPQNFRAALTLFYVQELGYEEMTSVLEIPLGTVKTHLARGRLLLRQRVLDRMRQEVLER
jgi:RNA polymerase sigma-70 factor (ECF subfamily)